MLFSFARVSWLVQFLSSALADQTVLIKTPSPLDEHFAQLVDQTLKEFHVPGVAVGVIDGDEVFTKVCLIFFVWLDIGEAFNIREQRVMVHFLLDLPNSLDEFLLLAYLYWELFPFINHTSDYS